MLRETLEICYREGLPFLEVVKRLKKEGVVYYYNNLIRGEIVYYLPHGKYEVFPHEKSFPEVSDHYDLAKLKESLLEVQAGKIDYPEFLKKIALAGVVGYFVFFIDKKVVYFSSAGDSYSEHFP